MKNLFEIDYKSGMGLSEDKLALSVAKFAKKTQLHVDLLNEPIAFSNPKLRPFIMFKRFAFKQPALLTKNIKDELFLRDENGKYIGSPMILFRVATGGMVASSAYQYAKGSGEITINPADFDPNKNFEQEEAAATSEESVTATAELPSVASIPQGDSVNAVSRLAGVEMAEDYGIKDLPGKIGDIIRGAPGVQRQLGTEAGGMDSTTKLIVGMGVSGTGIPVGAYVGSITDSTSFELSIATTGGSVTNGTLTFTSNNSSNGSILGYESFSYNRIKSN